MYLDKNGSCGNDGIGFVLVFCCAFWIRCGLFSEFGCFFFFVGTFFRCVYDAGL